MSSILSSLATVAVFSGAGATLKLADRQGENSRGLGAYGSAILSGVLLGTLMHVGADESSYVLGIVLGVAFGGKIDRPNLWAGLLTVAIVALILGLSEPFLWLVAVVAILSLIDEIGHGRLSKRRDLLGLMFRYRAALKIATILLAMASLISLTAAIGFLCFDLSYDAVSQILS